MSARDEVIALVRDALWAEFTRQAQVDLIEQPIDHRGPLINVLYIAERGDVDPCGLATGHLNTHRSPGRS
jgi:hypothetical protein